MEIEKLVHQLQSKVNRQQKVSRTGSKRAGNRSFSGVAMIQAIARTIVVVGVGAVGGMQGAPLELTRTAGLGASTTALLNLSGTGSRACWVLPNGKLALGVKLVALSASIMDFSSILLAEPEYEFPHYFFGTNELSWIIPNQLSRVNHDVAIKVSYRDALAIEQINRPEVVNAEGSRAGATWTEAAEKLVSRAEDEAKSVEVGDLLPDLFIEDDSRVFLEYSTSAQAWIDRGLIHGRANPDHVFLVALKVPPKKVPEPDTIGLLGLTLIGLAIVIRRRRRRWQN